MNTFNTQASTAWVPFKIPPTPSVGGKSIIGDLVEGDPYFLSPKVGADVSKNPSSQIEWSQIPINYIIDRITTLESQITTLENQVSQINSRISNATINASCDNDGNITITINI